MMKKYLMLGLAALAFVSCNKMDFEPMSQAEIDKQKYDAAFINYVGGSIAADQDWGFGSTTRGVTRGSYPNGNLWETEGWNIPPVLTDGQKERVYKYFQSHDKLSYTDPGYTNYWVQQVYKGGTDATNDYSKTAEKYPSANNGWVVGSDHMDHLDAVLSNGTHEHIFNFNYGNCTDWGGRMLMKDSGTHLFGYFNSDGSLGHTDYTGLVSWTVIEAWGIANGVGESLNDGWNRSFMGFDFEQVIGDDIFAKDNQVWEEGKLKSYDVHYLTYGDLAGADYIWNGTEASARPASTDFVMYNNQKVPVLLNETNMYCGDNGDIDQNSLITSQSVLSGYQYNQETQQYDIPYYQNQNCLDMTVINGKLAAGYLPVQNGSGAKWVKVHGGADGYFSDWIVTLIEAKTDIINTETEIRIIAEDLSATSASDFDFNDVVIDVEFGQPAKVTLLAAGGTLPLRIRVGEGSDAKTWEVHKLFNVWQGDEEFEKNLTSPTQQMVNTGAGPSLPAVEITDFNTNIANSSEANTLIHLEVWKNKQWQEMLAEKGEPASKLGVDKSFHWLDERVSIKGSCPLFVDWVNGTNPSYIKWW